MSHGRKMRRYKIDLAQEKLLGSIAFLIRNTTWKCGAVQQRIIKLFHMKKRKAIPVKELLDYFKRTLKLREKEVHEYMDAIRRLERRRILKIMVA